MNPIITLVIMIIIVVLIAVLAGWIKLKPHRNHEARNEKQQK